MTSLYDAVDALRVRAARRHDVVIDASWGDPVDPFPSGALHTAGLIRHNYPKSVGSNGYRSAVSAWIQRRFGLDVPVAAIGACVGTKEFVALLPAILRERDTSRDTVLYPGVAYPTYRVGALFAGMRAVPVRLDDANRLDVTSVDPTDADRAALLWCNSPANPTGAMSDLHAVATWARDHGIVTASDECYVEFTWSGPPRTILETGVDDVIAVHSLSKRSNAAGLRCGAYAGDPDLVAAIAERRKHLGLMMAADSDALGTWAWGDDVHVVAQRAVYRERLSRLMAVVRRMGVEVEEPEGAFYLWCSMAGALRSDGAPRGDTPSERVASAAQSNEGVGGEGAVLAAQLAETFGLVGVPGHFYGEQGSSHVRLAAVVGDDELAALEATVDRVGGLR